MKKGERWSPGIFAFYFGVVGGAVQFLPIVRTLPITPSDVLPSIGQVFIGVAVGAVIGAAAAWVRNLFLS